MEIQRETGGRETRNFLSRSPGSVLYCCLTNHPTNCAANPSCDPHQARITGGHGRYTWLPPRDVWATNYKSWRPRVTSLTHLGLWAELAQMKGKGLVITSPSPHSRFSFPWSLRHDDLELLGLLAPCLSAPHPQPCRRPVVTQCYTSPLRFKGRKYGVSPSVGGVHEFVARL